MKRILSIALLWLVTLPLFAQDVVIVAPGEVQKNSWEPIFVKGVSYDDLSKTGVTVTPREGVVTMLFAQGPDSVIWFRAKDPGKYTLDVSVNPWKQKLYDNFGETKRALADADPELLKQYQALLDLAAKYPSRSGSALVEVAGTVPPTDPPVDPTDPPVQPSKISRLTYVYEKDQTLVPRPVKSALQRINADSLGSVVASEFEDDQVDGMGQVPDQYAIALKAAREAGLPALVVQSGTTVVRVIKDPKTEAEVLEASK